nr:hypothetical protein GCM10020092_089570 [Actinoplanes digitatis]
MARTIRISTRNATFQQWQALLTNRNKRQRAGEFLVQGVRPISLAVERGWEIRAMLVSDGPGLSRWGARHRRHRGRAAGGRRRGTDG